MQSISPACTCYSSLSFCSINVDWILEIVNAVAQALSWAASHLQGHDEAQNSVLISCKGILETVRNQHEYLIYLGIPGKFFQVNNYNKITTLKEMLAGIPILATVLEAHRIEELGNSFTFIMFQSNKSLVYVRFWKGAYIKFLIL